MTPSPSLSSSSSSSWWTSALAVVALALLVTLPGGPRGCAANNIYGSGAINVQEVFSSLTKLYRYDRDRVFITFQTSTIPQALAKYTAGELDFFISDVGLSAAQLSPFNGIQIPMMGTPLVVAFNLPGFGVGDNLVMDRETLARIWYPFHLKNQLLIGGACKLLILVDNLLAPLGRRTGRGTFVSGTTRTSRSGTRE